MTLISFPMFKSFFFLVILLLHHAYAVPVHPRDEMRAAEILMSMSQGGHASHAPQPPQHQPPVHGHQPPASHHPAPQQRQVAQSSTEGHSHHHQHNAASPPVQHPSQSAQPQNPPSGSDKKNKCPVPGCGASFAKSDTLIRHNNLVHRNGLRRRLCLNFCQLMTNYCTAYKCPLCSKRFPCATGLSQHASIKHK